MELAEFQYHGKHFVNSCFEILDLIQLFVIYLTILRLSTKHPAFVAAKRSSCSSVSRNR